MNTLFFSEMCSDSSVSIVIGYGLENRGIVVRFLAVTRDLCLLGNVRTGSGARTSYLMSTGDGALFPGIKRSGREYHHSTSSSVEVKNAWNYTPTPAYAIKTWCLIKHRHTQTIANLKSLKYVTDTLICIFVTFLFSVSDHSIKQSPTPEVRRHQVGEFKALFHVNKVTPCVYICLLTGDPVKKIYVNIQPWILTRKFVGI